MHVALYLISQRGSIAPWRGWVDVTHVAQGRGVRQPWADLRRGSVYLPCIQRCPPLMGMETAPHCGALCPWGHGTLPPTPWLVSWIHCISGTRLANEMEVRGPAYILQTLQEAPGGDAGCFTLWTTEGRCFIPLTFPPRSQQ